VLEPVSVEGVWGFGAVLLMTDLRLLIKAAPNVDSTLRQTRLGQQYFQRLGVRYLQRRFSARFLISLEVTLPGFSLILAQLGIGVGLASYKGSLAYVY